MTIKTRNAAKALVATVILTLATLTGVSVVTDGGPAACGSAAHACVVRADGGTGNG